MKKAIQLLVILFVSSQAFGGQIEDIILKMQTSFSKAKNLEYTSAYELFKGHKSEEIYSSYKGYLCRNEKQVYQKIKNTEFIYGEDYFLKISHDERAVALDLAQKNVNQEINLSTVFEFCTEKEVVEKNDYFAITLIYKYGAPTPFGVVKMRIDKKTYQPLQLDLYYRSSQNFSDKLGMSDMAQPHLRIRFGEMKTPEKMNQQLFSFSNYIETKKNILSPTGSCKGYELIDNRI